jgi:hypothetical protein
VTATIGIGASWTLNPSSGEPRRICMILM